MNIRVVLMAIGEPVNQKLRPQITIEQMVGKVAFRDLLNKLPMASIENVKDPSLPFVPLNFGVYRGQRLIQITTLSQYLISIGSASACHLRMEDKSVNSVHAAIEVTSIGKGLERNNVAKTRMQRTMQIASAPGATD